MTELYKNIKLLREKLGMSQDELALLTGYTNRSSIAKIEKGIVDLSRTKIELFAKALNVSPGELMGWEENSSEQDISTLTEKKNSTFDKRLKEAMLKRNIKSIELSERTKIPKSSISQYLSGYAEPKTDRTYTIANVLNISPAWLLGYDVPMEESKEPAPSLDQQLEGIEFALLGEVKELTEEQKQDVLNFAKFIKEQNKNK
jgi:transcriptional regulator with XRE-family HTH domain